MNALMKLIGWVVAIVGGFCLLLYATLLDVWVVPSDDPQFVVSIEPTLSAGDTVLIARHGTPSLPDLVRCDDPDAPGRFVVARMMASGGDKILIASESVTLNGTHVSGPRGCTIAKATLHNPATDEDEDLGCTQQEFSGITFDALHIGRPERVEPPKTTEVPNGQAYLVSDNRHMHLDSRDFNTVEPAHCKHIVFRLWGKTGWGDSAKRFTFIP